MRYTTKSLKLNGISDTGVTTDYIGALGFSAGVAVNMAAEHSNIKITTINSCLQILLHGIS